jgi:DNA-binding transcriptional LysR family regulator
MRLKTGSKTHGHPRTAATRRTCPLWAPERNGPYLGYLQQHGLPVTEASFSCHAEHSVANWALVRAGMGIGAMMEDIARQTPGVVRVLDDVPPVVFPIWLVSHRELRTSRRIRVVFEALAAGLQQAA